MYSSATRRYTVGASLEWHLTNSFGFELDGMFHRLGYSAFVQSVSSDSFTNSWIYVSGDSCDFPIMAKYRFGREFGPISLVAVCCATSDRLTCTGRKAV